MKILTVFTLDPNDKYYQKTVKLIYRAYESLDEIFVFDFCVSEGYIYPEDTLHPDSLFEISFELEREAISLKKAYSLIKILEGFASIHEIQKAVLKMKFDYYFS